MSDIPEPELPAAEQTDSTPSLLQRAVLSAALGVIGLALGELVVAVIRGAHEASLLERAQLFADLVTFAVALLLLPLTLAVWVALVLADRTRSGDAADALFELAWGPGHHSKWVTAGYFASCLVLWGLARAILPHIPSDRPLVPRLLTDVSLLGAIAVVLLSGRIVVWRRGRSAHAWLLEPVLLVVTCWMVGFELTYFVVPTTMWYAPVVLVAAWTWVAMRVSSSVPPAARRGLGVVALAALICVVPSAATYDVSSTRHASLTWDTSIGAAMWEVATFLTDDDGDGYTDAFGGPDCDDADPQTHPGLPEDPLNGRDDNCLAGETSPLPPQPMKDQRPHHTGEKLNVVVIAIDTLRADYVGKQVGGMSLTPNLDRFATTAFAFAHAYSASSHTAEAMPAAWTGTYPFDWRQHGLSFGIERGLAEILDHLGYETWATIALTWTTRDSLIGFDDVDNELGYLASFRHTGAALARGALERLDARDSQRPFLMWTHFFDPHAPHHERGDLSDWLGSGSEHAAYMHEVHVADEAFGAVIDGLIQRGLMDDTVVVVFSDHGESLGEHGIATHKRNAHDSVMRVPLMLRLPGASPGRSDALVSTVDLLPTLTDALGIQNIAHIYGRTLMPLVRGEPFEPREFVYFEANEGGPIFKGIATQDHKLIYDWRRNAYFFYDLSADPAERRNLVGHRIDEFAVMRDQLWSFWDAAFSTPRLAHKAVKSQSRPPGEPLDYRGPALVRW